MSNVPRNMMAFTLGFGRAVDALLGLRALQQHYESLPAGDFVEQTLVRLGVRTEATGVEHFPAHGPIIVVANHPTGALDGLVLLHALRHVRPDVRVLGNEWLTRIPEMRDRTIPVDLYARHPGRHVGPIRQARRWLTTGGALVIFPAGAVARGRECGRSVDEPWSPGVLALARWSGAPIVPIHLDAGPSRWLTLVRHLPSWITTALLPRELLRQRGARVGVSIGAAVSAERLVTLPDASARLAYLRARVAALAPRLNTRTGAAELPVAPQVLPSLIAREVSGLAPGACLAESGPFQVLCASAAQIPLTLREIGRLREQTFRAVGEGTGAVADLDRFDPSYWHLFLWHRTRMEVVGAYRLAEAHASAPPLYTESLFSWRRRPHVALGDALELGRSFIRAEYQRNPAALLLLWRGIGAFVSARPHLRRLFGPVSISASYSSISRDLIARWLLARSGGQVLQVAAPHHSVPAHDEITALLASAAPATVGELDRLVHELECGEGLPVLLRQYLRLNGRVLAVSRDPQFADAMDALIVVDLLEMPAAHLDRYCGGDGARRIRRHWGQADPGRPDATSAIAVEGAAAAG